MKTQNHRHVINLDLIKDLSPEDVADIIVGDIFFRETAKDCNYDVKKFHQDIVMKGIAFKAIKSDWDVKKFVFKFTDIPFDYTLMTDKELKFLKDVYKRYFNAPVRHGIEKYMHEMKSAKLN